MTHERGARLRTEYELRFLPAPCSWKREHGNGVSSCKIPPQTPDIRFAGRREDQETSLVAPT